MLGGVVSSYSFRPTLDYRPKKGTYNEESFFNPIDHLLMKDSMSMSKVSNEESAYILHEELEPPKPSLLGNAFRSLHFLLCGSLQRTAIMIYVSWVLLGMCFYAWYESWSFPTALFFSVEAGLSIGFCSPVEKDDWSKLFTIFYVLLGSSAVSGAMGYFSRLLFLDDRKISSIEHQRRVQELQESWSFARVWYWLKYNVGWYSHRVRVKWMLVFVCVLALGVLYGVLFEKWSVITSLYFAVTAAATGGLQSPKCESGVGNSCEMGTVHALLLSLYLLVAVPVYAFTLAQFACIGIQHAIESAERVRLRQPIKHNEFEYAANLFCSTANHTDTLGQPEFIFLQLLRLGKTDPEEIEVLKSLYDEIDDEARSGHQLKLADLRRFGYVVTERDDRLGRLSASRSSRAGGSREGSRSRGAGSEDRDVFNFERELRFSRNV